MFADVAIAAPIALLYPSFFDYAARTYTDYDSLDEEYDEYGYRIYSYDPKHFVPKNIRLQDPNTTVVDANRPMFRKPTADEIADQKKKFYERLALKKTAETIRFLTLMAAGVVAIILGGMFAGAATAFGLVFGGLICFLKAYFGFWGYMDDFWKMVSTGFALAAMLVVSTQLYKKEGFFSKLMTKNQIGG